MKKCVILATFLIGFTAMAAQIVLLRQLITVFYGNEIGVGIFLGSWLFWGGLGSLGLGRFADSIKQRGLSFAALQIVLAVTLPATFLIIRAAQQILQVLPGELIGFWPMAGFSFCVLSVACIILGFLFTLACRIFPDQNNPAVASGSEQNKAVNQIRRAYIWEALGALCAGCLVSFILIRYFDGFYIILGLAGLNLLCAFLLLKAIKLLSRPALLTKNISIILLVCVLAMLFGPSAKQLKDYSIKQQWRGFSLLTSRDSIYNNLAVTSQPGQISFFGNGLHLFSAPDEAASEEAVHFALLETAHPQRVLLIGGALAGLATQALKHPLQRLDCLELDSQIVALGKQFIAEDDLAFLKDPRLNLVYQDGRLFIKRSGLISGFSAYDTVIVHLGNPYTAQINRFYTREFFQEVKQTLSPEGVFSFAVTSSENALNKEQKRLLSCIYQTLNSVFAEVKMIPGDSTYFLAAKKPGILTYDAAVLLKRLQQREIGAKFVREYYLFAKLSADRIAYLEQSVKAENAATLNSDFRPVCYYYDMLLWSVSFTGFWPRIFSGLTPSLLWRLFIGAYLLIWLLWLGLRKTPKLRLRTILLATSVCGLSGLSLQVIILLAFQIIYGYLYYKLGIILSFFMAGLVSGSWLSRSNWTWRKDDYRALVRTQAALAIFPLLLAPIFFILNRYGGCLLVNWLGSNVIFLFLPVISGFICGFQFPLANKAILRDARQIGCISGATRGMDLLGSFIGAILVSAFLIPVLGITQTCLGLSLLNITVIAVLLKNKKLLSEKN